MLRGTERKHYPIAVGFVKHYIGIPLWSALSQSAQNPRGGEITPIRTWLFTNSIQRARERHKSFESHVNPCTDLLYGLDVTYRVNKTAIIGSFQSGQLSSLKRNDFHNDHSNPRSKCSWFSRFLPEEIEWGFTPRVRSLRLINASRVSIVFIIISNAHWNKGVWFFPKATNRYKLPSSDGSSETESSQSLVAKTRYANIYRITMNAFVPVGACANFGSETAGTYAPASLCTGGTYNSLVWTWNSDSLYRTENGYGPSKT